MGKEIKFRPATFYLGIADMLAREVEGLARGGEDDGGERERTQMLESLGVANAKVDDDP
jgi:triacylglycerol lipase